MNIDKFLSSDNYISFLLAPSFRLIIPEKENKEEYKYFAFTLESIYFLFCQYFSFKNKELRIGFSHCEDSPICFRGSNLILLNTYSGYWSQGAYQFAHELCHYVIPNDVAPNLRWFEESICETASYFFLKQLSSLWQKKKITLKNSNGQLYYSSFSSFAKDDQLKETPFDIHNADIIKCLENNPYLRNNNKYIANKLLPIFIRNPEAWSAVPYLSNIPHDLSLSESLQCWNQLSSNGSNESIDEILLLFSSE